MEAFRPGPEHAMLKRLVGAWTANIKRREIGQTGWSESTGEFLARMDIGGFFLCRDVNFGLQGFQGRGITGWDPFAKSFVGTWIDSASPMINRTTGRFDENGVYCEESDGPDHTGTYFRVRMRTEIVDKDQMLFRYFVIDQADVEHMTLEIHHTRRRFG